MTDIESLRALHEAATPGPWFVEMAGDFDHECAIIECARWNGYINTIDLGSDHDTANLIAAMRNALPDLLDGLERLRAEKAQLLQSRAEIADEAQALRSWLDGLPDVRAERDDLASKVQRVEALVDGWATAATKAANALGFSGRHHRDWSRISALRAAIGGDDE